MSTLNVANISDDQSTLTGSNTNPDDRLHFNKTVDTKYVTNGCAKAWVARMSMSRTPTVGGSLNVSSLTDVQAGAVNPNWTNNFNSVNYAHHGSDGSWGMLNSDPNGQTVSAGRCYSYDNSFKLHDNKVSTAAFGELA